MHCPPPCLVLSVSKPRMQPPQKPPSLPSPGPAGLVLRLLRCGPDPIQYGLAPIQCGRTCVWDGPPIALPLASMSFVRPAIPAARSHAQLSLAAALLATVHPLARWAVPARCAFGRHQAGARRIAVPCVPPTMPPLPVRFRLLSLAGLRVPASEGSDGLMDGPQNI